MKISGAVKSSVIPAAILLAIEYFLSCLSFIGNGTIAIGLITPAIIQDATVENAAGFLLTDDNILCVRGELFMKFAMRFTCT